MKPNDKIEEVFKRKLANHEEVPPEGMWERIQSQIDTPPAAAHVIRKFRKPLYYAAAVIGGLILVSSYFFMQNETLQPVLTSEGTEKPAVLSPETITPAPLIDISNQPSQKTQKKALQANAENVAIAQNLPVETLPSLTAEAEIVGQNEPKEPLMSFSNEPELYPENAAPGLRLQPPVSMPQIAVQTEPPAVELIPEQIRPETLVQPEIEKLPETPAISIQTPRPDSLIITSEVPQIPVNRSLHTWYLGMNAGTDRMFNASGSMQQNYAGGLSLSYFRRNYFIQSGLGLDYSYDRWQHSVDYRQNELLGTYQKVDSIYFSHYTDSLGNVHTVPNFYTSVHSVYDSINHQTGKTGQDYFTYLQLPLLAGYTLKTFNKLDINIKGGPVFSMLIDKQIMNPAENMGNVRVLSTGSNRMNRLNTNWFMHMAVEMNYALSQKLFVSVEPTLRYFKDPIYQSAGLTDNPWSTGIRIGLRYGIKQNY